MGVPGQGAGKGKAVAWLRANAGHEGDACLTFPFNRNNETGYGQFGFYGEMVYAHRFMCEMVKGPAPSPKHYAAHECGKGHEGCVNPRHIDWKTPYENAIDRLRHGNNMKAGRKRNVLTPERAAEILRQKGATPQWELAKQYGVSQSTVSQIHRGVAWRTIQPDQQDHKQ